MLLWLLLPCLAWADTNPDIDRRFDIEALIDRAERSPLKINGVEYTRVERDEDGNVRRLRLDELELSPKEFRTLARIPSLRSLSLQKTNVVDADLAHLRGLPNLTSLVLNSTKVTDGAIPHLQEMPALRSLCLMRVGMTREGVDALKAAGRVRDRSLGIGFIPLR